MIGINDFSHGIQVDAPHNLGLTIGRIKSESNARICVLSVLPVKVQNIKLGQIRDMNQQYKQICLQEGADFLDLFYTFMDNDESVNMNMYSGDFVHLNGKGYRSIVNELNRYLTEKGFERKEE